MKWLKEIEAWLLPIKLNSGEASYEASAIDLTLKLVRELEEKNTKMMAALIEYAHSEHPNRAIKCLGEIGAQWRK